MDLPTNYQALARYNSWMNKNLYDLASQLSDEQRKRDVGAFFRSIHGTLGHLLLADRVQLGRFIGAARTVSMDRDGNPILINSLNQELYADFATLRREREATDAMIEEWCTKIDTEWLQSTMRYRSLADGGEWDVPLWVAVTHFFNHQAHHRGQATTMLKQFGLDPGVTDFMPLFRFPVNAH
ncbi:MAG TPA: DinB family protein [Candidatus Binataceae bacterium]|nr:DinB family protein [Candidatus Binataceae bacterium]